MILKFPLEPVAAAMKRHVHNVVNKTCIEQTMTDMGSATCRGAVEEMAGSRCKATCHASRLIEVNV